MMTRSISNSITLTTLVQASNLNISEKDRFPLGIQRFELGLLLQIEYLSL